MKIEHRLGLLALPLIIVAAAVFFCLRADGMATHASDQWTKLERAAAAASGEARMRLREDAQAARDDEDNALTQRAFWIMAGGFGALLLILAVVFQIFERAHAKKTDALIASFGTGEEGENQDSS